MSRKIILLLLTVLAIAIFIILIFIYRIDPYSLTPKEIIFFVILTFVILFCLMAFLQIAFMRRLLDKKEKQGIVLRRSLLFALYFALILALQIFNAFSILGAVLLAGVFLLLEFYFKSR